MPEPHWKPFVRRSVSGSDKKRKKQNVSVKSKCRKSWRS